MPHSTSLPKFGDSEPVASVIDISKLNINNTAAPGPDPILPSALPLPSSASTSESGGPVSSEHDVSSLDLNDTAASTPNPTSPPALPRQCASCKKPETDSPFSHCAACPKTLYCSRECQRSDWKMHKIICPHAISKSQASNPKPPLYCSRECQEADCSKPAICQKAGCSNPATVGSRFYTSSPPGYSVKDLLYNQPEEDVYGLLIDCFRMRVEDEWEFADNCIGIYAEPPDSPVLPLINFLNLAEKRKGVLPPWWEENVDIFDPPVHFRDEEKWFEGNKFKCITLAQNRRSANFHNIFRPTDKEAIQEHYEDDLMHWKLRVLGEKIYGTACNPGFYIRTPESTQE